MLPDALRFLNPWAFLLLALGPIAWALLAWWGSRRRIVLPHLPFLEKALAARGRRGPWRRRLLLFCDLLLFLLAVGLLARPVLDETEVVVGTLHVVVDRRAAAALEAAPAGSGRSVGEEVLDRAAEVTRRHLERGGDASWLLLGERLVALGPRFADTAGLERVRRWAAVGPRGAVGRGPLHDFLERLGPGERLVVVTAPGLGPPEPGEWPPGVGRVIGPAPAPNAGWADAHRNVAGNLEARLVGTGEPRVPVLRGGGRVLARGEAVVPTAEGVPVVLEVGEEAGARLELGLEGEDAWPADDELPLAWPSPRRLRVAVYGGAGREAILRWAAASSRVAEVRTPELPPPAEAGENLLRIGLGLEFSAPPSGPWVFFACTGPGLPLALARADAPAAPAEVDSVHREDPLLAGLPFDDWRLDRVLPAEAAPGARVLVAGTTGPLLVRGAESRAPQLALATTPADADGTLAHSLALPLLLEGFAAELLAAREEEPPLVARPGEVVLPPPGGEATARWLPDGPAVRLVWSADGAGLILPEGRGHLRLGNEEGRVHAVAPPPRIARGPAALEASPVAPFPAVERSRSLAPTVLLSFAALLLVRGILLAWPAGRS